MDERSFNARSVDTYGEELMKKIVTIDSPKNTQSLKVANTCRKFDK